MAQPQAPITNLNQALSRVQRLQAIAGGININNEQFLRQLNQNLQRLNTSKTNLDQKLRQLFAALARDFPDVGPAIQRLQEQINTKAGEINGVVVDLNRLTGEEGAGGAGAAGRPPRAGPGAGAAAGEGGEGDAVPLPPGPPPASARAPPGMRGGYKYGSPSRSKSASRSRSHTRSRGKSVKRSAKQSTRTKRSSRKPSKRTTQRRR